MDHNSNSEKPCAGPLVLLRPPVDEKKATQLAQSLFGLQVSNPKYVKEFESYDDRNFYMKGALLTPKDTQNGEHEVKEDEFVLKVLNHVDSANAEFVDAQNSVMLYLKEHGFNCPFPLRALSGEYSVLCRNVDAIIEPATNGSMFVGDNKALSESERINAIRLLKFVPGKLVAHVPCTPELLANLGQYAAKFNKALQGLSHPSIGNLPRPEWDLSQICFLESYIAISTPGNPEMRRNLTLIYDNFVSKVLPQLQYINKQVVHGDLNEMNIIVTPKHCGKGHEVCSVLDFGDTALSYRVFEVAICMMYMITLRVKQGDSHTQAIKMAGYLLCGYQREFGLSESALALLYWSIAGRFFQSIVVGFYKQSLEPENTYLSASSQVSYGVLATYISLPEEELLKSWLSMDVH